MFTGHFITPVDEHTCIDHWLNLRNFKLKNPEIAYRLCNDLRMAFAEDKAALEAINSEEIANPGFKPIRLAIDAAPTRLRRITNKLIANEQDTLVS